MAARCIACSDFLVITSGRVDGDHERALGQLHEEIPALPGYWSYNLEGSYAPKADLQTLAALGRPWLYVNRGSRAMEWSAHCNAEDVRWVLRERPLILVGAAGSGDGIPDEKADPATAFAPAGGLTRPM